MYEIWCIEANGERVLVRDDVSDKILARALVDQGNHGATVGGMTHRYHVVPDPDVILPLDIRPVEIGY